MKSNEIYEFNNDHFVSGPYVRATPLNRGLPWIMPMPQDMPQMPINYRMPWILLVVWAVIRQSLILI